MAVVTGYLSAPVYGLRMDIHEGEPEAPDMVDAVYPLQEDADDQLLVVNVSRYEHELPGEIGHASLMDEGRPGVYEAFYSIGDAALPSWGRRGVMTAAMRALLSRLIEQDETAEEIVFNIRTGNDASTGLAQKLGAEHSSSIHRHFDYYALDLAAYAQSHAAARSVTNV